MLYATDGAAAADLRACVDAPVEIEPGGGALIPSGIAIELSSREYCALVMARSGLSVKHGICLSNGVGLIDFDYRGEILVGLRNMSDKTFTVSPGDRIAQLMVIRAERPEIEICSELSETGRGAGGFGSTGI